MNKRHLLRVVVAGRTLLAVLGALGAVALAPAQVSAQAVTLDDTYTAISLNNSARTVAQDRPDEVKYELQMRLRFYGNVHDGDAVRVIWKRGATTLANIRCGLTYRRANAENHVEQSVDIAASDRCWGQDTPKLDAHGSIDVEVHYLDEQSDSDTVVRTLHLEIARTWHVDRVLSGRTIHSPRYYVLGDDLLGMSWVWLKAPTSTDAFDSASFYFWANTDESSYPEASMRCFRDGERVPEFDLSGRNIHQSVVDWGAQDDATRGGTRASTHYRYRLFWITPNWRWGTRNPDVDPRHPDDRPNLTATPGSYVCKFRSSGTVLREFQFTVANDTITPHVAQSAPNGLRMRPGAVFVETRFGDAAPHDIALVPDVIRRGTAFGQPWADAAAMSGMLSALPAARGRSTPPLPDGVRGAPAGRGGAARANRRH